MVSKSKSTIGLYLICISCLLLIIACVAGKNGFSDWSILFGIGIVFLVAGLLVSFYGNTPPHTNTPPLHHASRPTFLSEELFRSVMQNSISLKNIEKTDKQQTEKALCMYSSVLKEIISVQTDGVDLIEPQYSDFGIVEKDISEYDKYSEKEEAYKNRDRYIEDKFGTVMGITMWGYILGIIIDIFTGCNILGYLPKTGFYIATGVAVFFFLGGGYIVHFLTLPVVTYIVKPFIRKPAKPTRGDNVIAYYKAKEQYTLLTKRYGCDLKEIANHVAQEVFPAFIEKLVSVIKEKNRLITRENLLGERSFWENLSPRDFEREVAGWFVKRGYSAKLTPVTGDGGIDIILSIGEKKYYAQCKRYRTQKVDRPTLQQLYGTMIADKNDGVVGGMVVCLRGVTNQAQEFADKVGIAIYTLNDLAPEDDLFHQRTKGQLLSEEPLSMDIDSIVVGNITVKLYVCLDENCALIMSNKMPNTNTLQPSAKPFTFKFREFFFTVICDDTTKEEINRHLKYYKSYTFSR